MPENGFARKPAFIVLIIVLIIIIATGLYLTIASPEAETVKVGDNISVYYTGRLTNGTVFDSNVGKTPLNFTVGSGEVIEGFDNAVVGMRIGETKNITLPPGEAYGEINQSLIMSVPLSVFGNQSVRAGMEVTENQGSRQLPGIVTAVNSTYATINFNNQLAGKTLIFQIKVVSIMR